MLTAHVSGTDAPRTVFGALQVRSLLDDPALRENLGIASDDRRRDDRPERPANIRQLLELAAA